MTLYEYPLNERIRSYLRLEYLFDRLVFFSKRTDPREHQVAVSTIFDILDAIERTDVKTAVLQDLERNRATFNELRDHPAVAQDRLHGVLTSLETAAERLSVQGRPGQSLRENEWLSSVRGKLTMPGGASQIDLPSYYAWQCRSDADRGRDLEQWCATLDALRDGLRLVLQLLREGGQSQACMAERGTYQQMLGGRTFQLARVWLESEAGQFPEISANKYVVWVRFAHQAGESKARHVEADVSFHMALCGG